MPHLIREDNLRVADDGAENRRRNSRTAFMLPVRVGCNLLFSLRRPSAFDRNVGGKSKAGTYENLRISQELARQELATSVSMEGPAGFEPATKRL